MTQRRRQRRWRERRPGSGGGTGAEGVRKMASKKGECMDNARVGNRGHSRGEGAKCGF